MITLRPAKGNPLTEHTEKWWVSSFQKKDETHPTCSKKNAPTFSYRQLIEVAIA
jgi:hypothetical protein